MGQRIQTLEKDIVVAFVVALLDIPSVTFAVKFLHCWELIAMLLSHSCPTHVTAWQLIIISQHKLS